MTTLGGFPWHCVDTCEAPADCMMDGCRKLRDMVDRYVWETLAKYIGQENTPELRKQVVADLLGGGEKKR
jgi:hypothetical protein